MPLVPCSCQVTSPIGDLKPGGNKLGERLISPTIPNLRDREDLSAYGGQRGNFSTLKLSDFLTAFLSLATCYLLLATYSWLPFSLSHLLTSSAPTSSPAGIPPPPFYKNRLRNLYPEHPKPENSFPAPLCGL